MQMEYGLIGGIIAIVLIVFGVALIITLKADTLPLVDGFTAGPATATATATATAAPTPDCTSDEYQELRVLLAKIAAFKVDLLGTSGRVSATLHMPYVTKHDREQVSETAAKCLSRTIPARDIDLIFDAWRTRGHELIAAIPESNVILTSTAFDALIDDVYAVAKERCLVDSLAIEEKRTSPRDIVGITPDVGAPPL
jgi:hypothetical protein